MLFETPTGYFMISGTIRTEPRYTLTTQKETPVCAFAVSAQGRDAPLCNLKGFYDLAMIMDTAKKGDTCFAVAKKSVNESGGKIYTDYLVEFVTITSVVPTTITNPAPTSNAYDDALPF